MSGVVELIYRGGGNLCSLHVFVRSVKSLFFGVFHSWGLSKFPLSWGGLTSFSLKQSHFLGSSLSVEEVDLTSCRSRVGMCSFI